MHRNVFPRVFSKSLAAALSILAGLAVSLLLLTPPAVAEDNTKPPATKPAETKPAPKELAIKGSCTFSGTKSTWSAKLTPKGKDTYDAVYVATWGGKPLNYVGIVKGDLKTEISGTGKASGGAANGTFEFAGKFGADGIAKCAYKEVGPGRGRNGAMTVDPLK